LILVAVILIGVCIAIYMLLPKEGGGIYPPEIMDLIRDKPQSIVVKIKGFDNGSVIPAQYTCDGLNYSPEITITNIPRETVSIAIITFDPDAPGGVFYHWIIYNITPTNDTLLIPENIPKTRSFNGWIQGVNDFNSVGYGGPCPPKGSSHRYVWSVFALDTRLSTDKSLKDLLNEMKSHVIAYGMYYGTYRR